MVTVRLFLSLGVFALAGCSPDAAPRQKITGDAAAVAGWPRRPGANRFLVAHCCTLRLAADARATPGQGIDSIIHDVAGPGYALHIVFGPYDRGEASAGYRLVGRRMVDGVALNAFRWERRGQPPEGRLLWLAQVGGRIVGGVEHSPWGLRMSVDCTVPAACDAGANLVGTIRF